jgi:hypothetical protein
MSAQPVFGKRLIALILFSQEGWQEVMPTPIILHQCAL